jgi:NAD+-dependent protein deacetylase sirtuin 6
MSAGYASRLKDYPNKGICGLREQKETQRAYRIKLQQLTDLVRHSKYTVVLTGAGISTSAGIPDFRGPTGIWTLERQRQQKNRQTKSKKKRKLQDSGSEDANALDVSPTRNDVRTQCGVKDEATVDMNFTFAKPTLTHRLITELVALDVVKFVITQNVDGLHRRSGLSRSKHSVLHGCAFTEKCECCATEFFRDTDVGGMSFQRTGRNCDLCNGDLRDTLLDWEDPLPEDDLERSEMHCKKADLILCLGTSLRITPVSNLPLKAKQFVIVNLQVTPMDDRATLIIRERVDTVMNDMMKQLGYADVDGDNSNHQRIPEVEKVWNMGQSENNG